MTDEGDAQWAEFMAAVQSSGWTRTLVIWNTIGTIGGAVVGLVALGIALLVLLA